MKSVANAKPPKPKKCKCCGEKFTPQRTTQIACDWPCAKALAERAREKREAAAKKIERKALKEAKERLKTRRDYLNEAQTAFNAFVRERDKSQPCICCGQPLGFGDVGGAYDCGHYRSVGSAPHLRFDERNAHAQRKQCNRWGAGRAVDYRLGLIRRIGIKDVEDLEADDVARKWTVEELIGIRDTYRAKLRDIKKFASDGSIIKPGNHKLL